MAPEFPLRRSIKCYSLYLIRVFRSYYIVLNNSGTNVSNTFQIPENSVIYATVRYYSDSETVPLRSSGGAVALLRHQRQPSALCDVNRLIIMATAGAADSASTGPTGSAVSSIFPLLS